MCAVELTPLRRKWKYSDVNDDGLEGGWRRQDIMARWFKEKSGDKHTVLRKYKILVKSKGM